MSNTKKKIAVLGAFDRFNYGDLLFPIILEKLLDKNKNEYDIEFFALVELQLCLGLKEKVSHIDLN